MCLKPEKVISFALDLSASWQSRVISQHLKCMQSNDLTLISFEKNALCVRPHDDALDPTSEFERLIYIHHCPPVNNER